MFNNIICISGLPGNGKTTLAHAIHSEWQNSKLIHLDIVVQQYVLHLNGENNIRGVDEIINDVTFNIHDFLTYLENIIQFSSGCIIEKNILLEGYIIDMFSDIIVNFFKNRCIKLSHIKVEKRINEETCVLIQCITKYPYNRNFVNGLLEVLNV